MRRCKVSLPYSSGKERTSLLATDKRLQGGIAVTNIRKAATSAVAVAKASQRHYVLKCLLWTTNRPALLPSGVLPSRAILSELRRSNTSVLR